MKLKFIAGMIVAWLALHACSHAQQRLVFAHYMVTNQDYQSGDGDPTQEKKIAAYEREIRQAQSVGIDGFALNVGGWLHETYYIRYTAQMFEAALRLHSGFKLFFSADMCCGNAAADVEDMMRRFAGNPRYRDVYLQRDGRFVLTTFVGDKLGQAAWAQIRLDLLKGTNPSTTVEADVLPLAGSVPSNAPLPTFFVPAFFWGGETPGRTAIDEGVKAWGLVLQGAFYWGIAGVPGSGGPLDNARSSATYADSLHAAKKLYMAPVALQFWGSNANRYYEYSGASGMRTMWQAAIEHQADWVEIITWNDFIEGTYVSPIDDPNAYPGASFLDSSHIPLGTRDYFPSHAGATALLRYFIAWYKTGRQPSITQDTLYYFYRPQPKNVDAGAPPVEHKYGPVADVVYVTANLTAPATFIVRSGDRTTTRELPAGSTDVEVPLVAGEPPHFELRRGGTTVLEGDGGKGIDAHPHFNNFYYVTGVLPVVDWP